MLSSHVDAHHAQCHSDLAMCKVKYGLQALLAIDYVVYDMAVVGNALVKENFRTREITKNSVEEELLVFPSPHAALLVRGIKDQLLVAIQIQKPGDVLCRRATFHRVISSQIFAVFTSKPSF